MGRPAPVPYYNAAMTPPRQPSDPALSATDLGRAVAGDAAALERLLAAQHGRLRGFALRKVGLDWRGKIEPEDLLQETYVEVFAHIRSFAGGDEETFYHWITRIVENRFFDQVRHWRRKKRDTAREIAAAAPSGESVSAYQTLFERCRPDAQTPSAVLRRDEAQAALLCCIARLSPDYRTVVQRLYLRQEPYEAIAADLDRSPEAVRRLVSRALAQLRECLGRASRYLSRKD